MLGDAAGGNEAEKTAKPQGTQTSNGHRSRQPGPSISEEDQKVIVRSNGTVGYVGKDIAYHMWKFGLLGRDFGYRKFYRYPKGHDCWISTAWARSTIPISAAWRKSTT